MAKNSVTLEVILTGKGLKVVQKDLDKVTKSTNNAAKTTDSLSRSRDRYSKKEKGVAGATSNSTKAFSKMQQQIGGGSSGLVAAYATLAANIFAATAAFSALRNASKLDQVAEGLDLVGVKSGRNLDILAEKLREVSGFAVSTEQALKSAALASSAGFSQEQLLGLTKVAKGASSALGRDMTDALDRLVRGTAKLEPEILDELGIFIRIDDVVRDYARTVNKSAAEVTDLEKRQAFLNAAIAKGTKRFGEITDSVEANSFDKLSASFRDLATEVLKFINKGIKPAVDLLVSNQTVLAGATVLFASTISKSMLPALASSAKGMVDNALAAKESAISQSKNLIKQKEGLKVFNKLVDKIDEGTASQADYTSGLNSLDGSLATSNSRLAKSLESNKASSAAHQKLVQDINKVKLARLDLIRVMAANSVADAKERAADGLQLLQKGSLLAAWRALTGSIRDYTKALALSNVTGSASVSVLNSIKIGAFSLSIGLRALSTAFFALLGPLGLLLSFGPLIYDWFKNKFFPDNINEKAVEIVQNLDRITETAEYYARAFKNGTFESEEFAKAASGSIQTASDAIQEAYLADIKAGEERNKKLKALQKEIEELQDNSGKKAAQGRGGARVKSGRNTSTNIKLRKAKADLQELESQTVTIRTTTEVATAAVEKLKEAADKGAPVVSSASLFLMQSYIKEINNGSTEALPLLIEQLDKGKAKQDTFTNAVNQSRESIKTISEETQKLASKQETPYDKILKANEALVESFTTQLKINEEINNQFRDHTLVQKGRLNVSAQIEEAGFKTQQQAIDYVDTLRKSLEILRIQPGIIKKTGNELKILKSLRNADYNAMKATFEKEAQLLVQKQILNEAEITAMELAFRNDLEALHNSRQYNDLLKEREEIQDDIMNTGTNHLKLNVRNIEDQKKILKLEHDIGKAVMAKANSQREIRTIAKEIYRLADGTGEVSAATKLNDFRAEKKERQFMIELELGMKIKGIDLEYDLLEAKFALMKAEYAAKNIQIKNEGRILELMGSGRNAAKEAAAADAKASLARLDLEESVLEANRRNATDRITSSMLPNSSTDMLKTMRTSIADGQNDIESSDSVINDPTKTSEEKNEARADKAKTRLAQAAAAASPFIESLKALGPEGVLVASVAEGSFIMADAFIKIGEAGDDMGSKLAAVGNIIGAIGQIAAAASQQKIAAIDQEIDAEKKRDGKSASSLAKIKAMEAKKERMKRKAFEQNKKIQMAQTIINTSAAIVSVLDDAPPPFNFILAGMMGALGAAQLAIISGTSYQGGGSAGGSSIPSSISVGERSNSVDVSQKASGSELAGLRGGDTTNIAGMPPKPAFMGAKYRASGGPTAGYVVGEQGPELFVPETPGRVVPNDDMRQAQPMNVNFTIQAIDSSNFTDALTTQRGNIISMIREAANTYGETFLESVNDTAITTGNGKI